MKAKLQTWADIEKATERVKRKLAKEVVWENGFLQLNKGMYEIEESRIKTPYQLISWIRHLCEKTWINPPVIERIIDLWGQRWGIATRGIMHAEYSHNNIDLNGYEEIKNKYAREDEIRG
jgi:hypothetical protein